jgi:hypothetical protein
MVETLKAAAVAGTTRRKSRTELLVPPEHAEGSTTANHNSPPDVVTVTTMAEVVAVKPARIPVPLLKPLPASLSLTSRTSSVRSVLSKEQVWEEADALDDPRPPVRAVHPAREINEPPSPQLLTSPIQADVLDDPRPPVVGAVHPASETNNPGPPQPLTTPIRPITRPPPRIGSGMRFT